VILPFDSAQGDGQTERSPRLNESFGQARLNARLPARQAVLAGMTKSGRDGQGSLKKQY